ncbi:MAG TPA: cytochrome c oxidase subunit 3 [Isosphaeraceae bacterium]|nr:cytochrome c oxidase subunit 3 [Isosphaeraceae bacterium]
MAIATPSIHEPRPAAGHPPVPAHTAPVSPGKVAMWLFLATEVMFFTGLIGSYIVLRAGSPHNAYSNLYAPARLLLEPALGDTHGVILEKVGASEAEVERILHSVAGLSAEAAKKVIEEAPHGIIGELTAEKAQALAAALHATGAEAKVEPVLTHNWPKPYDELTNPLAINLTAANTFILICSSLTMVLALSAIQRGNRAKGSFFLLATVLIGSTFLSIQVYEYCQLGIFHHYPPGISATGHFRPSVSLFASCFYTMTGFHGAHVTGGVILLLVIFIGSLMGRWSATNYSPVELAGLYWHFVDLVWIILFTIVYLV